MHESLGIDRLSRKKGSDRNMANMGLTGERKRFLEKDFGNVIERDLLQKLSETDPGAEKNSFEEYFSVIASKIEAGVFQQDVSEEELPGISRGRSETYSLAEPEYEHCDDNYYRYIYRGGFPNCAATVEDGSWCWNSDACYGDGVVYKDMTECKKAWK